MRSFAISAGRRAATGLAAGATVTAAQPSVQAREVVQQAPCVSSARKSPVEDQDWLVTDFDQEVLVFKPFRPSDVDAAVEQVQAMMDARSSPRHEAGGPHSVVIEELDNTHNHDSTPASEAESYVSMGAEADAVLCQSFSGPSAGSLNAAGGVNGTGEVHDFLKIASKLLKRPGLQKEVFRCMLEDKEVCDLMLKQSRNIDAYLMAAGIHPTAGLLPAPEPRVSQEGEEGDEKNVLQNILEAVAACIDKTGSWLAGMGGWFKGRFSSLGSLLATLFGLSEEDEGEGKGGAGQQDASPRQRNSGDTVLGAVMVVTVAVFCVLLARSPGLLKTAAAGASAAAMAAQQQAAATRRTSLS